MSNSKEVKSGGADSGTVKTGEVKSMAQSTGKNPADGKSGSAALEIDPKSAEAFIAEKRIGERIKRLRLKKSMGLVELGRHTGLSASFLSQLETGRVVPTLRNLARIAMVFSKDLSYFFESEPQTLFRIHKKKDRLRLPQTGADDPTYFFESLGYMVADRTLDPYYAEFIPLKKGTEVRAHVHAGFEFLFVIEGQLEIRHGDRTHILDSGDSVYFDSNSSHSYRCAGETPAEVIIVTTPQQPFAHGGGVRRLNAALGTSQSPVQPARANGGRDAAVGGSLLPRRPRG